MIAVAQRDNKKIHLASSASAGPVAAALLLLTAVGCSEGTVVANGHVTVEGRPATGGRLSFTPVEGGQRAFSVVAEDGAFALRSSDGAVGALPGSYHVFFRQPLDEQTRKQFARELAGELAPDELTVGYRGPRDNPLVIPEGGDQNLMIDIRRDQGWTRHVID